MTPHHHIGTICDALTFAGIDTTRWSGRDVAHRQRRTIAGAEHRAAMFDQCRRALRTTRSHTPASPPRHTEPTGTHSACPTTSDIPHAETGVD
ncbi:hypothetical protein [Rhodococcus sp. 14C212]|uniref:hypothetical protein n=1 Tax=Rhodococcus sp. 14C212 TaxID=2711209 RepID=UPI003211F39B